MVLDRGLRSLGGTGGVGAAANGLNVAFCAAILACAKGSRPSLDCEAGFGVLLGCQKGFRALLDCETGFGGLFDWAKGFGVLLEFAVVDPMELHL